MTGLNMRYLLLLAAVCGAVMIKSASAQAIAFEGQNLRVEELQGSIDICIGVVEGTITTDSTFILKSIQVSATDGADFTPFDDERLTFTPGLDRLCRPLMIRQDGSVESVETVDLTISSDDLEVRTPSMITIFIEDSDRIRIGFVSTSFTVVEAEGPTAVCASRLTGTLSRGLTVVFTPLPGNATSEVATVGGQDYLPATQSVSLQNINDNMWCAMFGATDDNLRPVLEDIEFYQVSLSSTDSVDFEPGMDVADIFIEDNDGATVSVQTASFSLMEGNTGDVTPVDVCVILNDIQNGLERELQFSLSVDPGNTADNDFNGPSSLTITFPSDAVVGTEMCLQFEIVGDVYKEADETFTITVEAEYRFDIISGASQVTVTIEDDNDLVQFCEMLTNPTNGAVNTTGTLEDTVAGYSCIEGYDLIGDSTLVCQRNAATIHGVWSGAEPTCKIVDCGTPPPATASVGNVNYAATTFQSLATYSCTDNCYQLDPPGVTTLTCEASGDWSGSAPSCQLVDCGTPPASGNCTIDATTTECNAVATYSAIENFTIAGDETLICGVNGMWQEDPGQAAPFCIPIGICQLPPSATGDCALVVERPEFNSIEAGAMATYSCPTGCVLNGEATRECMRINMTHGLWSGDTPACEPVMCNRSVLMDPANGMVSVPSTMYLSVATYSCSVGFVILGNATRVCGADEMWSGEEPSCVPVECPPLDIDNGNVNMSGVNPADTATYTCNNGFTLVGGGTRNCQPDGTWTGEEPVCFMDCGEDGAANDFSGTRDGSGLTHGTKITYKCNSDMCPDERECNNGTWIGNFPSCIVPRCKLLSSNEGLNITYSDSRRVNGTEATYICASGESDAVNIRTCDCNGNWSEPVPTCTVFQPRDGEDDGLPLWAIIVIAIGAALILIVLCILLICCIAYCVRSHKNSDKQYKNYYREFMRPYTTPYNTNPQPANPYDGPPVEEAAQPSGEKTALPWEEETMQAESHLRDADDELPSPTPSDDNISEYRLRLHDVETQSTGSQHRIKPQIVAEKVEVEI